MRQHYEITRGRFLHGFTSQLAKITMIVIFSFFLSSSSFSPAGTLKGRIFDKDTKEPIPFANIVLELEGELIAGATSDFDGNYIIKPIPPGTYDLRASFVGYNTIVIKGMIINADQIRFFDIEMESTAESLSEIVVTDYKVPLINRDETVTGGHATSESYKKMSSRSSSSIATCIGGVYSTDGERGSVRGARKDATVMYIDGIRTLGSKELSRSSDKHVTKEVPREKTNAVTIHSRLLTAGEINDFSKWELWKDISENELSRYQQTWSIKPEIRYCVQVMNKKSFPIVGCAVKLLDEQQNIIWISKTDNTGKAEVWANLFDLDSAISNQYRIEIEYGHLSHLIKKPKEFHKGINTVTLNVPCDTPKDVDILFTVDATGSMSDEINYLKAELKDIIENFSDQQPELNLRLGSVFYRDKGDSYITKESDFSTKIQQTTDFIERQHAGGGGDFPEAVDQALDVSVNNLTWSENARTKLLFLILDAPPHGHAANIVKIQKAITKAVEIGIKIIPITASGINKSTEYLMRSMALATNGTYVFLTDDSGIGGKHIKPSIDDYDVELLNDLITRLLIQNTLVEDCTTLPELDLEPEIENKEIPEEVVVTNPEYESLESEDSKEDNGEIAETPEKMKRKTSLKVYPNPTHGPVTIKHNKKINEIFVIDIAGKILLRLNNLENGLTKINLNEFPNGMYFLKYANDDQWEYSKIVLKH